MDCRVIGTGKLQQNSFKFFFYLCHLSFVIDEWRTWDLDNKWDHCKCLTQRTEIPIPLQFVVTQFSMLTVHAAWGTHVFDYLCLVTSINSLWPSYAIWRFRSDSTAPVLIRIWMQTPFNIRGNAFENVLCKISSFLFKYLQKYSVRHEGLKT